MKLLYATSIDVPSTRANRLQTVSMAQEFHRLLGGNFLLGLRAKDTDYALMAPFILVEGTRSYILAWKYIRLAEREHFTTIYCREEKMLLFMILYNAFFFRMPVVFCYEFHHLAYVKIWWHRYMLRRIACVISITQAMKDILVSSGYPERRILVAPDAVDIAMFDIIIDKNSARKKLGLPVKKNIVLYAGTIHEPWKGVDVLYEAIKQLGDDCLCVVVGGKPHYVEKFKILHPSLPNVLLVGHRTHDEIPVYLKAADVLVLPNSAKAEISRISTSPMKLFEYMAAERPIVASDLPSIREILNERNALLVAPDDATALANGILAITENTQRAIALAAQARADVSMHTWENRAATIVSFITHA